MDENRDENFNETKLVRADRAMRVTKAIMWAVAVINIVGAAALGAYVFRWAGFREVLTQGGRRYLVELLLYWLFILPPSSGFGLGTAVFFLRDQLRIGRFDKSCVVLIALFSLSLAPGLMFLGSMVLSMLGA